MGSMWETVNVVGEAALQENALTGLVVQMPPMFF